LYRFMMKKPTLAAALAGLCLTAAALPALAQQPVFADRAACLTRADALPDFAYEEAKLWERQGGAADARLCQALALMLRGDWALAAPALEASARELDKEPRAGRADLWARAALSWTNAKQPDKADAAYAQALTLMPGNVQILMDRAISRAGQERYWDAIADLDKVIEKAPKMSEAWLLRAQAHHVLALDSKAKTDVEMALQLSPQSGEALLLRGNLYADAGIGIKAKEDWEKVRRVAPGTSAAASATDNLNTLTRLETEAKDKAKAQEKKEKK
jgi:regulator of sirC expression with transglutaminase-like and TPR domain